jgi:hypothetical protein
MFTIFTSWASEWTFHAAKLHGPEVWKYHAVNYSWTTIYCCWMQDSCCEASWFAYYNDNAYHQMIGWQDNKRWAR